MFFPQSIRASFSRKWPNVSNQNCRRIWAPLNSTVFANIGSPYDPKTWARQNGDHKRVIFLSFPFVVPLSVSVCMFRSAFLRCCALCFILLFFCVFLLCFIFYFVYSSARLLCASLLSLVVECPCLFSVFASVLPLPPRVIVACPATTD